MAPSSPAPSKTRVTRRWCHSAWPLREGKDFFGRVGSGSIGGASTEMAASGGKTDGAIISGALENGGDGTIVPVAVAVKRGWVFFR